MKALAIALAGLTIGQSQTVSIRPHTAAANTVASNDVGVSAQAEKKRIVTAGMVILGYILGPGPAELRVIVGSSDSPRVGDQVVLPADTQRVYLPPEEHYALLERRDQPVSIWNLSRVPEMGNEEHGKPIGGAGFNPDLVTFSSRGEAVVCTPG